MKRLNSLILSTFTAALLTGCGGDSTSESSIAGTVAIGLGIESQVEIMDVNTCEVMTTRSDSSGAWSYTGNLSSYVGPFLLKASTSLGFTMYSYFDMNGTIANITPFTHYATDAASRASGSNSISNMYSNCDASAGGLSNDVDSFNTNLNTTVSNLRTSLSTNFPNNEYANENPFTIPFSANQTGYDALLDNTDISLHNNDTFIRLDNGILHTTDDEINGNETISISSSVQNSNGESLDAVNISIDTRNTNIDFEEITTSTNVNGIYTFDDIEEYRDFIITYSKEGYTDVTQNYSTFTSEINPSIVTMFTTTETLDSITPVSPNLNITDSRSGDELSSVTIKIREGYNNRLGEVINTIDSSDGNGLSLTPGTYTFELNKIGYENDYLTTTITPSTTVINVDLLSINTSSTSSSNAFATIIVRWGENPADVDSHLLFDDNHISYYNKFLFTNNTPNYQDYYETHLYDDSPLTDTNNPCVTSGVIASLDLDDTTSYGPETTTICDGTKGPFEFKLHHFSGSSDIGTSPTTVELITRDGSRYEFTAPTTGFTGTSNDVWNVFTLNADQVVERTNTIGDKSILYVNDSDSGII